MQLTERIIACLIEKNVFKRNIKFEILNILPVSLLEDIMC